MNGRVQHGEVRVATPDKGFAPGARNAVDLILGVAGLIREADDAHPGDALGLAEAVARQRQARRRRQLVTLPIIELAVPPDGTRPRAAALPPVAAQEAAGRKPAG